MAWLGLLPFGGGIAVGLVGGWLMMKVRTRMSDPVLITVVLVLTPFLVYLVAEEIHASGVLAVVVCGLLMAHHAPRSVSAQSRAQATPFWNLTTFVLNGSLFVLIGLALPKAVSGLSGNQIIIGMTLTAAVCVTMLATRLALLEIAIRLILAHKRATLVRMRDERVIDDTVLRRIQNRLDIEELRIRGPVETE